MRPNERSSSNRIRDSTRVGTDTGQLREIRFAIVEIDRILKDGGERSQNKVSIRVVGHRCSFAFSLKVCYK